MLKPRCIKVMRRKAILVSMIMLLLLILIIVISLTNTLSRSNAPREGVHVLDSLTYPSDTLTMKFSGCRILVNETKSSLKVETQTTVVTAVVNGSIVGTTTVSELVNTVNEVHSDMDRSLPIIEYACNNRLLIVEFTRLKQVKVSKILLTIREYVAPVTGNVIKSFSEESDKIYVELVNGSRKLMEETLSYTVEVEQGGFLVLEEDNRSIVKLVMALNYFDGFVKQYGIEIVGVKIEQICLDSNCTTTITP